MKGTIKTLNPRGFGFITVEGMKDVFFHSENVVGTTFNELKEGSTVSFELSEGPKGPFAANVTVA